MKVFNLALLLGLLTLKYGWPHNYEELCNLIPKVELHAHLHGSIRQSTLEEFSLNRDYVGVYRSLSFNTLGNCVTSIDTKMSSY